MQGYITYPTYRIKENKAYVHFFGKLDNGESFCTINYADPYFFIKKKDLKKAQSIAKDAFKSEETDFKDFKEHAVVKIIVDIPSTVPKLRKAFEKEDIVCYEADVRFAYRSLINNDILGTINIEGDYEKGEYVDRIYKEPKITNTKAKMPNLTILSFDIETNKDASKVFSIALIAKNKDKKTFWTGIVKETNEKIKGATSYKTEKELLEAFAQKIREIDPDIITGWNVIDFDLRVLRDRFKYNKVPFILGRTKEETKVRIETQFFKDSKADIVGRQVLDGIALLKGAFIKLPDYKLDTAAHEILGKSKTIKFAGDKAKEIEDLYKNDPQKLVDYNKKDAVLVLEILEAKDLFAVALERSLLTGMPLERVNASIASLDSLYIRETRKRGYVCYSARYSEREERIKGGFVRSSNPGIYDYIVVCDFKSLYPSIIRTFNIDPLSFQKDGTIVAPNKARFRNEEGILPMLIQRLWEQRDKAKKRKDAVASYAIKIIMNSFFGVLASPLCRFYSLDMGNAITHWGQGIVKETALLLEKKGYTVIYGDTDSIFIDVKTDNYKEAKKTGEEIAKYINEHFTKQIKKEYKRDSFLELEFEKVYKRFIMPRVRGTEKGAKKRYAGLITDGKKEKLDIVGLETVRRDWTECAKIFQQTLLNKIFNKQEVAPYIKKFVTEVKAGKHDNLLVYRKALRKDVDSYIKTTPPHVKAARLLKKIDSNIIQYYITVDGPQPVQSMTSEIDYGHYVDKQIKPIADAILVFFKQKFEDVISGKKQTSLFDY